MLGFAPILGPYFEGVLGVRLATPKSGVLPGLIPGTGPGGPRGLILGGGRPAPGLIPGGGGGPGTPPNPGLAQGGR